MRILDELTNDKNITEVTLDYKECIYTKPGIWMQWNKLYTCQIHVFENLGMKRKRCGTCTGCKQTHDCGICVFCSVFTLELFISQNYPIFKFIQSLLSVILNKKCKLNHHAS